MADCDENAMSSRCRSGGEGTTRGSAEYLPLDEPFHANLRDRAANGQYANLYFARLAKLRPAVQQQMAAKWGLSEARLREMQSKTLDVPEEAECIVLGTFYAEMKLKPNVLEEYTRDPLAAAAPVPDKYCGPGDKLIIEDETGRLVISGALVTQAKLVTGVVLAVRGQLDPATSIFAVNDICIADMSAQPPLPASVTLTESEAEPRPTDHYLALVSGLNVGAEGDGEHMLALQLLCDYLSANVGGGEELGLQRQIVRLVVCGNSLAIDGDKPTGAEALRPMKAKQQRTLANSLQAFEAILLPVAASMPIDLMPGITDPSNLNLPQQPFHHCLLPLLARHASFTSVPNPHCFELGGLRMLGTSGQPVSDAHKYHETEDAVDTLESMLRWRHLAPTAPDTLPCFPYAMADPFILNETPHLLFAGNQSRYGTRLAKGADGQKVRLVAVPDFSKTRIAVLVNLRTLRCHPLCFQGYGH